MKCKILNTMLRERKQLINDGHNFYGWYSEECLAKDRLKMLRRWGQSDARKLLEVMDMSTTLW